MVHSPVHALPELTPEGLLSFIPTEPTIWNPPSMEHSRGPHRGETCGISKEDTVRRVSLTLRNLVREEEIASSEREGTDQSYDFPTLVLAGGYVCSKSIHLTREHECIISRFPGLWLR